ncbi:TM2 domain-containing protein [Vagococcus salmoninarum]|uniref:TM2 domain-containing protein n=1 Tax=Vagococcus salmoninarum TaxID=2739 RepID=UPI003F952057
MSKIIKLEEEYVVIATQDESIVRARYEWLNFRPQVGDQVEVFEDGDELIVHQATKTSKVDDKININIVNENTQHQTNFAYTQAGKVINKWLYILVALFLGGFGIHKFMVGQTGAGVMYLLFCWTGIPALIAFFSAIGAIFKTADINGNIII